MSAVSRFLTAAMAVVLAISTPCAAALAAPPSVCTMAGCGSGLVLEAPRAACCCAPTGGSSEAAPTVTLVSKTMAATGLPAPADAPVISVVAGRLHEFRPAPPSPVPLFLLNSALLI